MTDAPDGNALARALAPWAGRGAAAEGLTRLSGGASKETWSFDAVGADGTRAELILRRDPPGRPSEQGAADREAVAIGLAHAAGLPVPELLFSSPGPGPGPGPGSGSGAPAPARGSGLRARTSATTPRREMLRCGQDREIEAGSLRSTRVIVTEALRLADAWPRYTPLIGGTSA
jgi:hypothetical protein